LTGNATLEAWWPDLLGPGKLCDFSKYFVVCSNVLGSCYGSSSALTVDAATGKPYGPDFPVVTVRDSVRLHIKMLKDGLGVKQVACAMGGSLGGMQVMEWLLTGGPEFVKAGVSLAAASQHSPWQIGISEVQRAAIRADPNFKGGHYKPTVIPREGVSIARQMAMISYRTAAAYDEKFGRLVVAENKGGAKSQWSGPKSPGAISEQPAYDVEGYLRYQGDKFNDRGMDANCYINLTIQMDTHDISRGRGGDDVVTLKGITQPVMLVSIDSDALYPPYQQKKMADNIPNSEYHVIRSNDGHDGFLLEQDAIQPLAMAFLKKHSL
jgi:homoserine O-acetyltransferase